MAATMTVKAAATTLRRAANHLANAEQCVGLASAAHRCTILAQALRQIEDAQIVLRNDPCWRERAEADVAAKAVR